MKQHRVKQHRLLMATDLPFWRKSTGAEQRIDSLVRYLASESIEVRTFYTGQLDAEGLNEQDRRLISGLEIEFPSSDQPPRRLADKIGWYADATIHQLRQWSKGGQASSDSETPPTPPAIEDYRWPWAITAFRESIDAFDPTVILIQYIKLGYLLEALSPPRRVQIQCMVDTHDVLHRRADQFRSNGFDHWIEIDREAESRELKRFDTILAIQEEEADVFREMAPDCETIVCGYSLVRATTDDSSMPADSMPAARIPANGLVVGYIGSANASNIQAMKEFLNGPWSAIRASDIGGTIEIVIAGGVCERVGQGDCGANGIRMLGRVDSVESFYECVDVVINPVTFGSGLKIKNCEAISFGKPLITTEHGSIGMPSGLESGVVICQTPEKIAELLLELAGDSGRLEAMCRSAAKLSQTEFSVEQAYSELKQSIFRGK